MFGLLFGLASCLIEELHPKNNYGVWSYVLSEANTVHFIQSEAKERIGNSFQTANDRSLYTRVKVYKGEPNNPKALLYQDEKSSEMNTFFFTTPERDSYYILLELVTEDEDNTKKNLGLDVKVFSGEANRPGIVSTNDVEVSRAENLIERVLEFVKQNIAIQGMDEEDELVYKRLYEKIMKKVVYVLFLKIVATIFTMYYSNKKTKSFYASQGLGSDK